MRGINCADLGIATFPTIRSLPADVLALLDDITSPFMTLPWWNVVVAHAMPARAESTFVATGTVATSWRSCPCFERAAS
jgi:hypothetical protein